MSNTNRLARSLLAVSITVAAGAACDSAGTAGDAPRALDASDGPDGAIAPPGRLTVIGPQIVDPDGAPLVPRGYSWGAWGTAQPEDGPANAAAGATVVRIPLRWWGEWRDGVDCRDPDAPGHISPSHLAILDQTVQWATENHLWAVIFVDSNYGQGAPNQPGHDQHDNFWTNPPMRQEFVEVWRFLIERYRGRPYIGAYELLPEPRPPDVSDAEIRGFYEALIPEVRALDARTPVIIGPGDGYNLRLIDSAYTEVDPNVIYTGNYFIFDHPLSRMDDIDAFVAARAAPVWIDQVGIETRDEDALGRATAVLGALAARDVGWAWWQLRDGSENTDGHGVYYQDGDGGWVVKPEWLALVDGAL